MFLTDMLSSLTMVQGPDTIHGRADHPAGLLHHATPVVPEYSGKQGAQLLQCT